MDQNELGGRDYRKGFGLERGIEEGDRGGCFRIQREKKRNEVLNPIGRLAVLLRKTVRKEKVHCVFVVEKAL